MMKTFEEWCEENHQEAFDFRKAMGAGLVGMGLFGGAGGAGHAADAPKNSPVDSRPEEGSDADLIPYWKDSAEVLTKGYGPEKLFAMLKRNTPDNKYAEYELLRRCDYPSLVTASQDGSKSPAWRALAASFAKGYDEKARNAGSVAYANGVFSERKPGRDTLKNISKP